jgi:hypothetical protein
VREFLKSQISEKPTVLPVVELAQTCLTYLRLKVFEEGPCENRGALKLRVAQYKFSVYAAQFWSYHSRGQAEDDPNIRVSILQLLQSIAKRNALLQIERRGDNNWFDDLRATKYTTLHLLALNGLATTYKFLLDEPDALLSAHKP